MADIAPQPFINYGLSQAQQGQAQSTAALQGQQAQAAAMQNQIMKARMPFIMRAYQQAGAQSSTSGVDGQGQPGGPMQAKEDALAGNGFDADKVTAANASRYLVPEWTPQEEQNTQMAAISNDPGMINYYAMQRQQRLDTMRQRAVYDASIQYGKYAAAANAPSAYEYLKQADKPYTSWLDRFADEQGKQGNPIDKNQASLDYAKYQAADLHRYTNRKIDFKNDQAVDQDNGLPVAGVPRLSMSAKDQAQFMKDAQTPSIEVQTGVPGQTKKIAPWQAAGHYANVHDYLAAVEQKSAPSPQELSQLTAGKVLTANQLADLQQNAATQALQRAGQGNAPAPFRPGDHAAPDPLNPGVPIAMPPHPKQKPQAQPAAPPQAAPPGLAPTAPPQGPAPAAPAPAPTPSPNAPFRGNETLDGVDTNKLPKYTPPQNPPNTGASTQQNLDIQAHNKEKYDQLQKANQQLGKNANERGLLDQAQAEVNRLRANPRAVGPGSEVTTAWNSFWSYATGQTPDALTERKLFDKVLLQMGAVNVKQAFDNQNRIGQQEYMKLLTEGNPTGKMPLDAIQQLVNFARYNNEFSTRANNTKIDALNKGADPYSRQYNTLDQGRAAYVQTRMGASANVAPIEIAKEKDPDAAYRALAPGAPYLHEGRTLYKGGGQ
jgi:hypothetical protein